MCNDSLKRRTIYLSKTNRVQNAVIDHSAILIPIITSQFRKAEEHVPVDQTEEQVPDHSYYCAGVQHFSGRVRLSNCHYCERNTITDSDYNCEDPYSYAISRYHTDSTTIPNTCSNVFRLDTWRGEQSVN